MIRRTRGWETVTEPPMRSSIWDKWQVAGRTEIPDDLSEAKITVTVTEDTRIMISRWAERHEEGHVGVADDLLDECGSAEHASELMQGYDRWQSEVEAWVRASAHIGNADFGYFILDCLNSYRRGLKISDEEWDEGVEVIASMAQTPAIADAIRNYVPIEPYDDQPPPQCGSGPGLGEPEPREGEGEGEDESESGEGEDGEGTEPEDGDDESEQESEDDGGEPAKDAGQLPPDEGDYGPDEDRPRGGGREYVGKTTATLDERWNASEVINALSSGSHDLEEMARELGVPVSTASPLAKAVAIR